MSKKINHIPLEKTRVFIAKNKAKLNKILTNKQHLQYSQRFGKNHFENKIEDFIIFFRIDKNISYALQTINYFNSNKFVENISNLLNFKQFDFDKNKTNQKEFFYGFCYILYINEKELFETFCEKLFVHFHSSLNTNTSTNIDFKDMAIELAKTKKIKLNESFGELDKQSYFIIKNENKILVDIKGKSIKTLRKKAYKKLFYYLLDFEQEDDLSKKKAVVYELMADI